jgi:hypothetical protein
MEFFDTFIKNTWIGWNAGMEYFTGGNRKDYMSAKTTQDIADFIEPGKDLIPDNNKFRMKNTKEREIYDEVFNKDIPGYKFTVVNNKLNTTWNNTYSIYLDLIYNTLYKDALIFNTSGKIRHSPGSLINIKVDDNKKLDGDLQTAKKHPH